MVWLGLPVVGRMASGFSSLSKNPSVLAKYSDDAKDLKDRYVHLTNYSINKLSSQYTANEDANACQGHKW
jgi:hypothetical protein